jgi:hypothetical protein
MCNSFFLLLLFSAKALTGLVFLLRNTAANKKYYAANCLGLDLPECVNSFLD